MSRRWAGWIAIGIGVGVGACLDYGALNPCFDRPCTPPSSNDGGPPSLDAAGQGDAMGVRCSEVPDALLCEDFDEPDETGPSPVMSLSVSGTGQSARSTDVWTSSPSSLRSTADPSPSSAVAVVLEHDFASSLNRTSMQLSFDLMVERFGASSIGVASILSLGSTQYQTEIFIDNDGGAQILEDIQHVDAGERSGTTLCDGMTFAVGSWIHVSVTLDFAGGTTSVGFGTATPPCVRHLTLASMRSSDSTWGVRIGIPWAGPQGPGTWIVHHDSVVVP